MESLRIYFKLIRISMQSRIQYRADFIIGIISVIVLNAVNLGLIGILVNRFTSLNGWSVWEMVFLYSMFVLGHSIYSLLFWHFNQMDDYIIRGTFDQFLIRPVSPFVQFIGREIQYIGFGDLIVGVASFAIAYAHLGLHWGLGMWLFFVLACLSGTILEMAIRWIIACTAFWTGRSMSLTFVMNRFNLLVQQYPIDIFGAWFRVVVTLIPIAFMNYYPSLVLLGKTELGLSWAGLISPVVALLSLLIGALVWRQALKRYASSGS
ncbi:ABC transporter permease [Paenibacillus sp. 32O-W]|uniref:ABC transporter permease n=1 Tax=Paenibacillus sp. 32O-W TaxID=1695218 RepID=UPI00119DE57B|nr:MULTISPECIES: ABC-2 family transporter protein [Paenibacillaceae]